jgi:hypothetical protein
MNTTQKSLKQKNSEKNGIPGEVFSLYFLLQDNDVYLTYTAKCAKNPKMQVI